MAPQFLELGPCGHRLGRGKGAHHPVSVGRIQIPLEEPVFQTLGTSRKAEFRFTGGLMGVGGPCDQLIIGQSVDIRALGQILKRLFVGRHDIAGLHPRDVLQTIGAQFRQTVERVRRRGDAQIRQIDQISGVHRRKITMQRAKHPDRARSGLQFRLQTGQPRTAIVGLVIHLTAKARQDLFTHGLGFFYGFGLCRPEKGLGLRGNSGTRQGDSRGRAQKFGKVIHVSSQTMHSGRHGPSPGFRLCGRFPNRRAHTPHGRRRICSTYESLVYRYIERQSKITAYFSGIYAYYRHRRCLALRSLAGNCNNVIAMP